MSSLIPGHEYDIFISYRQKDNKYDGWVTEFYNNLRKELEATFKEDISIYFDENPHDGILEAHQVDQTVSAKLNCIIFIPILSRTYCDPNCFAWKNEFLVFVRNAANDQIGPQVKLKKGNIASRVLPIRIHELDSEDISLVEKELGSLRAVDFIFKTPGVNRPLRANEEHPKDNLEKTYYRDQVNKVANFIADIINGAKLTKQKDLETNNPNNQTTSVPISTASNGQPKKISQTWNELLKRNVLRAAFTYVLVTAVLFQFIKLSALFIPLRDPIISVIVWVLIAFFPIALVMAWFFEVSPDGLTRITSTATEINPYTDSQKKPFTNRSSTFILMLLLIIQFIFLNYLKNIEQPSPSDTEISIAILPFVNRGESRNEYFVEALTEDINAQLSKINKLRVVANPATQAYKGQEFSFAAIAEELGVSYLLIGSVQQTKEGIRVAPQLIEVKTNKYVWSEIFNRNADDILELQSDIAKKIADILLIRLTETENDRMDKRPTRNLTAYDYYIKGRYYYSQYQRDKNDSAIILFKKAIELDNDYALAWAGLGDCYNQLYGRFSKGGINWLDSAKKASEKSIEIDSTLSEGYKSLASAYNYAKQYEKGMQLMRKAVALNPNNIAALGNLGTNYFFDGQFLEALRWQKKSAALNPRNYIPYQIIGWIYRLMGDLSSAEVWLKKSLEIKPVYDTYLLLGYVYVCQHRNKEALKLVPKILESEKISARSLETAGMLAHFAGDLTIAKKCFQKAIDLEPSIMKNDPDFTVNIHLGQILLSEGNEIDADILLSYALEMNLSEIEKGSQDDAPPFNIACIYAIRGKKEETLHWLDKAIAANWCDYAMVTHGPWFEQLRNDPVIIKKIEPVKEKMNALRKKAAE